jgi:hypothetical protein
MGFNASLVILCDRLGEIERDPEFGKKVAAAIREHGFPEKYRRTFITGQTQVVGVAHADTEQVIVVGGNTGRLAGFELTRTKAGKLQIVWEPEAPQEKK